MWCDREDDTYVLQENMVVVNSHGQTKYHYYHKDFQLGLDDYNLDDERTSWREPIFAVRDNDDGPRRVIADAGQETQCKSNHTSSDQSERSIARTHYGFPAHLTADC